MRTVVRLVLLIQLFVAVLALAQAPDVASLKVKANSGDAAAQLALARAYEKGEGLAQNDDLAAKWYKAAAERGNAEAQSELGVMYRFGRGVPQDKQEAMKWYRKSAKQGFGPAMFNLATCYYNGDGVGISDRLAYAWFVLAQRAGSANAAEAVARMQTELDPPQLVLAEFALAELVEKGTELPKPDPTFAFEIYQRLAASHSDTRLLDAKFQVGRMYSEGIGVAQNATKALEYLEASKTPQALQYLATMYFQGRGVSPNPKKAIAALNQVVAMGEDSARVELAAYYWDGGPIPQDRKLAVKHYTVLATQNAYPLAFYRLGLASRDGLGAKKSIDDACLYFVLAVNTGSLEASNAARETCEGATLDKAKERALKFMQQNRVVLIAVEARQKAAKPEAKSSAQ